MEILKLYSEIKERLRSADIAEADTEAALFLEHYLNISRHDILLGGDVEVSKEKEEELEGALDRRTKHEPFCYITGTAPFMGLDFYVDNRVLIPRADTEILVEEALKDLNDGSRILDICTGSGCILISLLKFSNDCTGVGIDISEGALMVAKKNAEAILTEDKRPEFLQGDLLSPLSGRGSKFEMIVSNPPYIATDVVNTLQSEVKDFEPMLALDGSDTGLIFYERIIPEAKEYLTTSGRLLLEIGYDQGEAVKKIMEKEGFIEVNVIKDYAGLDRVVTGIKSVYL